MKKIFLLFLFMLSLMNSNGQFQWQVITDSNTMQFSSSNNYDVVLFPDCSFSEQYGAPQLPYKVMRFVLPYESVITGITVTNTEKIPITGQYYLLPLQPLPIPDGSPLPDSVPPDPAIYNSQTPFPSQIAEILDIGFLMDYLIVTVRVCPFEYLPALQQLSLYRTVDFTITYTTSAPPFALSQTISTNRKNMVQNMVQSIVENYSDVAIVSGGVNNIPTDGIVQDNSISNQYPCNIYNVKPEYIIITTNALKSSFSEFVTWKNQKGVPTVLVTLEDDIIGKYPGNDSADQIRSFTKSLMYKYGPGLFFLLGGDVNLIPARIAKIGPYLAPTDLYYATKESTSINYNWNKNGNNIFGESGPEGDYADDLADAFLGRLPVRKSQDVEDYTEKMKCYERLKYWNGEQFIDINPGFLERILALVGAMGTGDSVKILYSNQMNAVLDDVSNVPSSIFKDKLYSYESTIPIPGGEEDLTKEKAIARLNNEQPYGYNLVIHYDHSGPYTMGMGVAEYGDILYKTEVEQLDNKHQSHVLISYGCTTNKFTLPSISKSFIKEDAKGCIAYIGSTISDAGGETETLTTFCQYAYYHKEFADNHIGAAFTTGFQTANINMPQHRRRFNLLGDPEAPLWGAVPTTLSVELGNVTQLVTGNNPPLIVTVSNLPSGTDALVCISKVNEVYITAEIPGNGTNSVTISGINPNTTGSVKIMVTAKNCRPYEYELPVYPCQDPNLYVEGTEVLDNLPSQPGNDNGIPDAGEVFQLETIISNSGGASSLPMNIVLSKMNPLVSYLTISQNSSFLPGIPANNSAVTFYPFQIEVYPNCQSMIQYFKLDMPSGSPTWVDNFPLTICSAELSLSFIQILDLNGNPINPLTQNGTYNMYVEIKNTGNGIANDVMATLVSNTPSYLSVLPSSKDQAYGNINAYSSQKNNDPYIITISNWNNNQPLNVTLNITSTLNTSGYSFQIILNPDPQIETVEIQGYRSTEDEICLWWNSSTTYPRYNIYRSNTEIGGYERINNEIIQNFSGYTDFNLPELSCFFYKVCCVSSSGIEGPLSSAVKVCTTIPYYPGWPVTNVAVEIGGHTMGSPITEDVDKDMQKEIFLTTGSGNSGNGDYYMGAILAFKTNGQEYMENDHNPTWSTGFYKFQDASCTSTPAIEDINNDGIKEIIVTTCSGKPESSDKGKTIAFSSINTYEESGWTIPERIWDQDADTWRNFRGPVICGTEEEEYNRIGVKGDWGSPIFLLNAESGETCTGWGTNNTDYTNETNGLPGIADLDSDGNTEYILGFRSRLNLNNNNVNALYVWKNSGDPFAQGSTPAGYFSGYFYSHETNGRNDRMDGPPVVADINGDGKREIILVAVEDPDSPIYPAVGHVICLNYDENNNKLGYPITNWGYSPTSPKNIISVTSDMAPAVAVADVIPETSPDPPVPEIFVADQGYIYGWDKNCNPINNNFPIQVPGMECRSISPLIADVDGDQSYEIIVVSNSADASAQGIYAFDIETGALEPGWPIRCGIVNATPCIDDVDFDGKNELIATTSSIIHMWKTEGVSNKILWGKYRSNNYNNAVYSTPCSYTETPLEITSDVTWYQDVTATSDIIIRPGASLTLNANLFMPSEATIFVEPSDNIQTTGGGKLIIDGGKITTNCSNLWKGVELWGLSRVEQTTRTPLGELVQGQVQIINGGAIMNAEIGILASKRDRDDLGNAYGFTGGHILGDSGYFVNNKIAVQFDPYEYSNASIFRSCSFLTTGKLLDESDAQETFVKMNGINTISFYGCTFRHKWRDSEPHYSNHGTGIYSENSSFHIDVICQEQINPCPNPINTTFDNLTRGIYAMNSGMSDGIYISEANFLDNYQGLYLSGFTGTSNASVLSSKFRNTVSSIWSYGMYLNECSEFHVENNEFYEIAENPTTIGLIVNNSGTNSNEIYRNTFHNLKFATLSQNENRNYDPPLDLGGLCYKCNKFVTTGLTEPNRFDFAITYDGAPGNTTGIAKNQGTYLSGSNFSPAGNMFQPDPVSSHYDFYNEGNPITYFYHLNTTLWYRLKPQPENIFGPVSTSGVNALFNESSCPSTINSGGGSAEDLGDFIVAQSGSDSIGEVLTALVDGGSTTLLNFEVVSSTPPEAMQVRSELLAESPYLSDSVLKTSVSKEDVLDNAMIRDVLVANPHSAKSDEIMNMLEYRANPMPDYMMDQILAGEDTLSAKEILEARKAWWDGKAAKSYARLLNYYKGDSIIPVNEDSLNWLFSYRNTLSSYYDKTGWYHSKGQFTQANSVLSAIPGIFTLSPAEYETHEAYADFYLLSEQLRSDTTSSFTVDSITSASMQFIAESNKDVPGAYARNLLLATGMMTYQEPIILPDTSLKQAKKPKFRGVKEATDPSVITVFPNPANDYFIIKFNLEKWTEEGLVNMYDITGKIVRTYFFTGKQDQIVCSTVDLKSGLYVLSLIISNKQLEKVKIAIVK